MKDFARSDLFFSLCGLNCGLCAMHLGGYCPGCGGGKGNQPCKLARCSLGHGKLEYCSQCEEFPCKKYEKIDEFDSFITHRNQKKDLEKQKKMGPGSYQEEQKEKIRILEYLLERYNDGRKKTLFCTAVNFLTLEDLKAVLIQAEIENRLQDLPLKERAAGIAELIQELARQKGISLKLRKKG